MAKHYIPVRRSALAELRIHICLKTAHTEEAKTYHLVLRRSAGNWAIIEYLHNFHLYVESSNLLYQVIIFFLFKRNFKIKLSFNFFDHFTIFFHKNSFPFATASSSATNLSHQASTALLELFPQNQFGFLWHQIEVNPQPRKAVEHYNDEIHVHSIYAVECFAISTVDINVKDFKTPNGDTWHFTVSAPVSSHGVSSSVRFCFFLGIFNKIHSNV